MGLKSALLTLRHNAGEAFLHAVEDIRQKVVEEGWTGSTQTPSRPVDHQFSDPMTALYGATSAAGSGIAGALRGPEAPEVLINPTDRGIDFAYAAFKDRCIAAGIDPKDRDVSDLFWGKYAAVDHGSSWMTSPALPDPGSVVPLQAAGRDRSEELGVEL